MSYPRWPAALPKPLREGLSDTAGDGRKMTQPDAGTPRVRRGFSRAAKPVSMTLIVTRSERAVLETFCEETLKNYALAFVMADPQTDGWGICDEAGNPLTDEAGNPLTMVADWLCLFGNPLPTFTPAGVDFRVSFQIMVLPL